MVAATARVNSPDVFQCFARASLTVVWARAGTASARIVNSVVFMICLGSDKFLCTSIFLAVIVGNGPHNELRALLHLFEHTSQVLRDDAEAEQLNRAEQKHEYQH